MVQATVLGMRKDEKRWIGEVTEAGETWKVQYVGHIAFVNNAKRIIARYHETKDIVAIQKVILG